MHIQADRALIPAAAEAIGHLHVTLVAPPAPARAAQPRPPVDVALVLDRSGSMDGTKIRMAQQAVSHALRLLAARDHFALVVYDDTVDVVQPRTAATAEAVAVALRRLAEVDARGSTNLADGWCSGAAELRRAVVAPAAAAIAEGSSGGVRRVLLLTDGLANQGVTDHDVLADMAAQFRQEGIGTSTFGVGADFDETLLVRLARQGGGHFYYIESPAQLPDLLTSELGEALDVVARDVVFEIVAPAGVHVTLLHDVPATRLGTGGLQVRVGDRVADQERHLLLGVTFEAARVEGDVVEVRCQVRDRAGVFAPQPLVVPWRVVSAAEDAAQPVNGQVRRDVAETVAADARLRALAANRRHAYGEARGVLQRAIDFLRLLAPDDPMVQRLAAELAAELEDVAMPMGARERKVLYQRSYLVAESREPDGKARRRRAS